MWGRFGLVKRRWWPRKARAQSANNACVPTTQDERATTSGRANCHALLSAATRPGCKLKLRESQFREADERLEFVSAGLAFPQVPHATRVQILRPFRQEDRFPALGALIDRSRSHRSRRCGLRRSIKSGAACFQFHVVASHQRTCLVFSICRSPDPSRVDRSSFCL